MSDEKPVRAATIESAKSRAYTTPRLKTYGKLTEVTAAGSGAMVEDVGSMKTTVAPMI